MYAVIFRLVLDIQLTGHYSSWTKVQRCGLLETVLSNIYLYYAPGVSLSILCYSSKAILENYLSIKALSALCTRGSLYQRWPRLRRSLCPKFAGTFAIGLLKDPMPAPIDPEPLLPPLPFFGCVSNVHTSTIPARRAGSMLYCML